MSRVPRHVGVWMAMLAAASPLSAQRSVTPQVLSVRGQGFGASETLNIMIVDSLHWATIAGNQDPSTSDVYSGLDDDSVLVRPRWVRNDCEGYLGDMHGLRYTPGVQEWYPVAANPMSNALVVCLPLRSGSLVLTVAASRPAGISLSTPVLAAFAVAAAGQWGLGQAPADDSLITALRGQPGSSMKGASAPVGFRAAGPTGDPLSCVQAVDGADARIDAWAGGGIVITQKATTGGTGRWWGCVPLLPDSGRVEVTATQVAGPPVDYGIALGQSGQSLIVFGVNVQGHVAIWYGGSAPMYEVAVSPVLLPGYGAANTLAIQTRGPDLAFYVNGTLVYQVHSDRAFGGHIQFSHQTDQSVLWRNLRVSRADGSSAQ